MEGLAPGQGCGKYPRDGGKVLKAVSCKLFQLSSLSHGPLPLNQKPIEQTSKSFPLWPSGGSGAHLGLGGAGLGNRDREFRPFPVPPPHCPSHPRMSLGGGLSQGVGSTGLVRALPGWPSLVA